MGMMLWIPIAILCSIDALYWASYKFLLCNIEHSELEEDLWPVLVGWPDRTFFSVLCEKLSHMSNPGPFFTSLLALMAGVFVATAGQFALGRWGLMNLTGDRDLCFYNEACYYPAGRLSVPANHMLSHIPYYVAGCHVIFQAVFAERRCRQVLSEGGQVLDLRPFYTIACSFIAEGLGSSCYHVCPSVATFQFDTCFMIPIAHLCCGALARWPEGPETQSRAVRYFLFIITPIWFFNFIGTWYDVKYISMDGALIVWYYLFAASVMLWAVFAIRGIDHFFQDKHGGCACLLWSLKITVWVVLALAMFFPAVRVALGGMANTFLLLSLLVMFVLLGWQVTSLELRHHHAGSMSFFKIAVKYSYLLIMLIIIKVALSCFAAKVVIVDPGVSAAESHESNRACVVGIFDLHDIWHALSAIGLALLAMALLDVKVSIFARECDLALSSDEAEGESAESLESTLE